MSEGGKSPTDLLKPNDKLSELHSMLQHWNETERKSKRRLVKFQWSRMADGTVKLYFNKTSADQLPLQGLCVSCIWWESMGIYVITNSDLVSIIFSAGGCPDEREEKQKARKNLQARLRINGIIPARQRDEKTESFLKMVKRYQDPEVAPGQCVKFTLIPWNAVAVLVEAELKRPISKR